MSAPTTVRPASVPPNGPPATPGAGRLAPPDPADAQDPAIGFGQTFLAAAAIVAGSSALATPISGRSWVLPLIEVVAVIWLVGVGGRLIRLPTAVTVLLQLAGFAIALTSLFTSTGLGGVLPDRSAVLEAGTLLSGAWDQIVGTAPPAPSTPELSFLISLAVGCAALIADFLVAEARSPALLALPLLCLYSVPASIATTMLPWYSFAAPAVLYAFLLAVTGHRERRTGLRAGVGFAVNGGAITALATVAALWVAGSAGGIGTTGRLPHTNGNANSAIGLSPFATLQGNLTSSTPVNVLTASGLTTPDYFSTVALTSWTNNRGFSVGSLSADLSDIDGPLNGIGALATDKRITVSTQNFQDRYLPILTGTSSIDGLNQPWNFDASLDTVFRDQKVKPGQYVLSADQTKPTDTELEADDAVGGGELTATGPLAAIVRQTAVQVTDAQTGAFDKARALEQWFTNPANGFVYSLKVKPGSSGDALVDFLNNKQGFCEQYASAMAIMLRSLNIPTRVMIGFTQGVKQAGGDYLITSHDAHAWVEVKFENNGWVRFDPTPPVDGQGGQQGFEDSAPAVTSTAAATTTPPVTASNKVPLDPTTVSARSSAVATQVDLATGTGTSSSTWIRTVLVVVLSLAVLAALLLIPTAVRIRRRGRRLALAGSGRPGAAAAAWAEIEDTGIDHGILPHLAESARVTANRLARRAHLADADRVRLRTVVVSAEQEWYGRTPSSVAPESSNGSTATLQRLTAADGAEMVAGVRSLVAGLRQEAPPRLSQRILPLSMRRSR